jgi:hypothetical protein
MNQPNLPVHLQRFKSRDLGKSLSQNLGTISPPYVSIARGRFTLIDAAGNEQPGAQFDQQLGVYIDACIIDVGDHISRTFYEKDYDPSAATFAPPECWSDNGVGPSTACSKPQSATCASCQWAVWGSAVSAQGKAIPACSQVQKLALLIPAYPQVVFLLRVPPNSHKHLRAYNELSKRSDTNIPDVITRIYFDSTTQGTLLFAGVSWIDEAVAQAREAAYAEKKADTIVGRNDVARPALAAPAGNFNVPQLTPTLAAPQPGPFVQPTPSTDGLLPPSAPVFTTVSPAASAPTSLAPGFATPPHGAPTASPSSAAPPQRRRRRTAAEMEAARAAEANGTQAPAGTSAPAPAAPQGPMASQSSPPQAPFPHAAAAQPGQQEIGFGMAHGQPADANPEVAQALDQFFQA